MHTRQDRKSQAVSQVAAARQQPYDGSGAVGTQHHERKHQSRQGDEQQADEAIEEGKEAD